MLLADTHQASSPALDDSRAPVAVTEFNAALDLEGISLDTGKPRTSAEIRSLEQKIALVARVFSKNYSLDVLPSPSGGWACGVDPKTVQTIEKFLLGELESIDDLPPEVFRPKQIFYDTKDVARAPEDEVLGVLRHEVGHANHSDYRLFFKGQRIAHDEGYLPTGWANIHNALEDPWVNNREIADSEVVRQKMTKRYAATVPEVVEKIGTQPLTRQLALNIIHHWLKGESIPTLRDRRVLDAFEKIKPFAEQYFRGPSAQENFDNLLQNIWPIYRELEQKALSDESLKELARRVSSTNFGQPQKEGGSPGGEGSSLLSKLTSALKRVFGGGSSSQTTGPETEEMQQAAGKDLQKAIRQELERQQEQLKKTDQKLHAQGHATGKLPDDIDLSKLAPEIAADLNRLLQKLPGNTRESIESSARESLDAKQAKALEQEGPAFLKSEKPEGGGDRRMSFGKPPKNRDISAIRAQVKQLVEAAQEHEQAQAAEQDEQVEAQQGQSAEQIRQELERREMIQAGFSEHERDHYARFRELEAAMQSRVRSFIQTIEKFLPKREDYEYGGEHYTGKKIDLRSVTERAPVRDYRIFQRREPVPAPQARMYITLLIDNSGSMQGQKMEESLKTAIFWGRVLQHFEIPFSIKFFGDHVLGIKKFTDDYEDGRTRVKPSLVQHSNATGGWTDIGSPLLETEREMALARRKYPESTGAIFVISDSGANRGHTGDALKEIILRLQKNYLVSNFILSQHAQEIQEAKRYFGEENVVAPKSFGDLPDASFRVLRMALERMLRAQGVVR